MNLARLAAAVLVLAPVSASAQTAGEAVAYAFLGIGDGATLSRGKTTMSWKQTGIDPTTFEGDVHVGNKSGTLRFIVRGTDKCHYEITIEGPATFVPGTSRLYGRVSMGEITGVGVSDDGHKAQVAGSGFCETGPVNPACVSVDQPDLFGAPEPARQKAAYDLLVAACRKP
jgi:hypothetical protein